MKHTEMYIVEAWADYEGSSTIAVCTSMEIAMGFLLAQCAGPMENKGPWRLDRNEKDHVRYSDYDQHIEITKMKTNLHMEKQQ